MRKDAVEVQNDSDATILLALIPLCLLMLHGSIQHERHGFTKDDIIGGIFSVHEIQHGTKPAEMCQYLQKIPSQPLS